MNESDATLEPSGTADLRAGGDGLPIQVRRNRAVLRLLPFFPVRRNAMRITAGTVATALLVMLVSVAAWRFYADWRLGWIELTNDGPPLMAQVLPESSDEPLGEPFSVMTRSTLALPAGDYRLRVHGVGRLGRTYRFAVNRGETQAHSLSLEEGRLLGRESVPQMGGQEKPREEPIPFAPVTAAIELTPGKADLIELSGQALIRRDGRTGKAVWDSSRPSLIRKSHGDSADRLRRLLDYWQTLQLVQPAPDLDGDGIGDLVWTSRNMASFLAVSGRNGSVLWEYALEIDGPGGPPPDDPGLPGPLSPVRRAAFVIGTPGVTDLDGDGTSDLVATIVFYELPTETEQRSPSPSGAQSRGFRNQQALARRMIQAISGRSGRMLWNHPVDPTFTMYSHPAWNWPATMVPGRKPAMVTYVDGAQWIEPRPGDRQAARESDRPGVRARPTGPVCGPGRRRRARDPGAGAGPGGQSTDAGRVRARLGSESVGRGGPRQVPTPSRPDDPSRLAPGGRPRWRRPIRDRGPGSRPDAT